MARHRDPFATALRTLRERAIAGVFSPGKPIIILDEAQALGLSTTPVREALAWLGGEGLIARAPAGGYAGLQLEPAGLASRYRLRLHCLEKGLEGPAPGISLPQPTDQTQFFRHIVAGAADPSLTTTYDRIQATIERFAEAEARLLGDIPEALEDVAGLLNEGLATAAAARLGFFHERRVSAAPLLTEMEQSGVGGG